ncbi:patatin-like phospholipase family protein [Novosphingobium rosa]|uniref:patatin-like phospholipase family protein n=1 Tax=Novosphingobium rosa TaxID=76978 RepID=UPI00082C3EF0|nr:patatin-like phospholipase family protein [Novosphingobium rosa]
MHKPTSTPYADARGWKPERCDRVALVLQGGGALGAYQAGVFEALHEVGVEPDWISGVSIGAINSALIAGNPPERRVEALRTFWNRITDRKIWHYTPDGDVFRQMRNMASSWATIMLGQPGFFEMRPQSPWFSMPGADSATSYYDTSPLRETLVELVDFDLLNDPGRRFSVGAVNMLTGNFVYFDSKTTRIEPEHVMASGALPPGFPAVRIGTDYYWDGGLVSNTPLQHLLAQDDGQNSLVFQVDLFSARGSLPRTIQDVAARQKDILYSSRTRNTTDMYQRLMRWKKRAHEALLRVPEDQLTAEDRAMMAKLADQPEATILQLIYQQKSYEGDQKDYEFSGTSMKEHWMSGYEDTRRTLLRKDWLQMPPPGVGLVTHDVHRDYDNI